MYLTKQQRTKKGKEREMKLEKQLKDAMIEYGAITEKYRIKIISIEHENKNSDYANVIVEVYKPRSRKPDIMWNLFINMVREILYWDKSSFAEMK